MKQTCCTPCVVGRLPGRRWTLTSSTPCPLTILFGTCPTSSCRLISPVHRAIQIGQIACSSSLRTISPASGNVGCSLACCDPINSTLWILNKEETGEVRIIAVRRLTQDAAPCRRRTFLKDQSLLFQLVAEAACYS